MKNLLINIFLALNAAAMTVTLFLLDETSVPIHYGATGEADGFGSKWTYLIFAILPFVLCLAFSFYNRKSEKKAREVKKGNKENEPDVLGQITEELLPNRKYEQRVVPIIALLFVVIGWVMIVNLFRGTDELGTDFAGYICITLGALMVYTSNLLPKIERNRTFGIKLYWTLNNDEVWDKTHRFGGITGVIGGFLLLAGGVCSFIFPQFFISAIIFSFILSLVFLIVLPTIYSYIIYRKVKSESETQES